MEALQSDRQPLKKQQTFPVIACGELILQLESSSKFDADMNDPNVSKAVGLECRTQLVDCCQLGSCSCPASCDADTRI